MCLILPHRPYFSLPTLKVFFSIIWGFLGNSLSGHMFSIRSHIKTFHKKYNIFRPAFPISIFPCNSKHTFFGLKIAFVLANSVDTDEMPHYVAFHLTLPCFPKYACRPH